MSHNASTSSSVLSSAIFFVLGSPNEMVHIILSFVLSFFLSFRASRPSNRYRKQHVTVVPGVFDVLPVVCFIYGHFSSKQSQGHC